jgi:hypothetical protein
MRSSRRGGAKPRGRKRQSGGTDGPSQGVEALAGKRPSTARRRQDVHADESHDRRMRRRIPARQGVPEGEGKIKRERPSRKPNIEAVAALRLLETLKVSAATRKAKRVRSEGHPSCKGVGTWLRPCLLKGPSNTARDAPPLRATGAQTRTRSCEGHVSTDPGCGFGRGGNSSVSIALFRSSLGHC